MNQQYLLNPEAPVVTRNRKYIMELLAKPFLLGAGVVIIIATVLAYALSIVQAASMLPFLEKFAELASEMTDGNVSFSTSANFSIGNLTGILLIASLIAMCVASRKQEKPDAPKGAVTAFHIWTILSMIGNLFTAGLFLLLPLLFGLVFTLISTAGISWFDGAPVEIPGRVIFVCIAIFTIIFIGYAVLYIINGISGFRFGSSLKKSITTPELSAKGCKAFAATNIINSVLLFFSSIISSVFLLAIPSVESPAPELDLMFEVYKTIPLDLIAICSAVTTVLSLVAPICLAIFALRYKKHIENAGENGCNLPEPAPFVPVQTPQPVYTGTYAQPQVTPAAQTAPETTSEADNENPYAEAFNAPETPAAPVYTQTPAQENSAPAPRFCNMCGRPVTPEQNFCNGCGNKLR